MIKKTCSTCVGGAARVGGCRFLRGKRRGCGAWSLNTKTFCQKQALGLVRWETVAAAPEACEKCYLRLLTLIWHESPQVRRQGQTETEYTRV